MSTDLTSEFTHFKLLVIRLSNVQQFALRFISLFECPAVPAVPGSLAEFRVCHCEAVRNSQNGLVEPR